MPCPRCPCAECIKSRQPSPSTPSTKLIALQDLKKERPDWPWSAWATNDMIRKGRLTHIRIGKRIFVTHEILDSVINEYRVDREEP